MPADAPVEEFRADIFIPPRELALMLNNNFKRIQDDVNDTYYDSRLQHTYKYTLWVIVANLLPLDGNSLLKVLGA